MEEIDEEIYFLGLKEKKEATGKIPYKSFKDDSQRKRFARFLKKMQKKVSRNIPKVVTSKPKEPKVDKKDDPVIVDQDTINRGLEIKKEQDREKEEQEGRNEKFTQKVLESLPGYKGMSDHEKFLLRHTINLAYGFSGSSPAVQSKEMDALRKAFLPKLFSDRKDKGKIQTPDDYGKNLHTFFGSCEDRPLDCKTYEEVHLEVKE